MTVPLLLLREMRNYTSETLQAALDLILVERAEDDAKQEGARARVRRAAERAADALERSRTP